MKRCRNGHDMTAENTAWRGTMPRCLTCKRDRDKRRRAKNSTGRRTGPIEATVLQVWLRDGKACVRCGKLLLFDLRGWQWSVQHRRARGAGGSKDPQTNQPANLLILCGSATTGCHGWAENEKRAQAETEGYVLRHPSDPESAPLLHPLLGWVLLRSDHYEPVAA